MKVLIVHNFYQISGGEDDVFKNEVSLLKKKGHDVKVLETHNHKISGMVAKILTTLQTAFSFSFAIEFNKVVKDFKPDVVHVHNTFPLISPSIFYVCSRQNLPVVYTLHNYRCICPTSLLMFNNRIEERSIYQSPWWALRYKVYRRSLFGTFILCLTIDVHKKLGTWNKKVDAFICLTDFAKHKYIQAGWPNSRIHVKPNFTPSENLSSNCSYSNVKNYAIYVGRLSEEKGIDFLVNSWAGINYTLVVIGDGPKKNSFESTSKNIRYLGQKDKKDVLRLIKNAKFLVMTSTWYEGFPMVLVEAFSQGTCAIVPNIGGMAEIVRHGHEGLHFKAGESNSFKSAVRLLTSSDELCLELGKNAYQRFSTKFTEEKNYPLLIDIYNKAIDSARVKKIEVRK